MRLAEPSGKIGHAEISIGGATMYVSDEHPDFGREAPDPSRGAAVTL